MAPPRQPALYRKTRKLLRSPGAFVRDFLAKRGVRPHSLAWRGSVHGSRRYSVVSAVYNVAPYLDDYFRSLTRQTLDFRRHIELILVDDGSTDDSAAVIRRWQRKYPDNIRYVHQENGGQASARNLGIDQASGAWVTFIDPDDFVDRHYFAEVERALASAAVAPGMVSCRQVFFHEQGRRIDDSHPLKYRFGKGNVAVDFSAPARHVQLSASLAFLELSVLHADPTLRMDPRIRPSFEDAHFVNRYLEATPRKTALFLASARYYYRKRAAGTSTLDRAWHDPRRFGDALEFGALDLLRRFAARGPVPLHVQRAVLYDYVWLLRRQLSSPTALSFLDAAQRARFHALSEAIFAHIDADTILGFELAGTSFQHKLGMLRTFGKPLPDYQSVYVDAFDAAQGLLRLRYFTASVGFEAFLLDGRDVHPVAATVREHMLDERPFVSERIVWIPLPQTGELTVRLDVATTRLVLAGARRTALPAADIRAHFAQPRKAPRRMGLKTRLLRLVSALPPLVRCDREAWLLMDRDTSADDNAEHLYRYLRTEHPHIPAYFVLCRNAADWERLSAEGFRLVRFGSLRHKLLWLNCRHVVSSHVDAYVLDFLPPRWYGDRVRHRFTFLQHGVVHNDLSAWLNAKRIDCLVAASRREADGYAGPSRYKFSSREVALTGLPRHDRLLAIGTPAERVIVVMPTWRHGLAGATVGKGSRRHLNPAFADSAYFRQWRDFLCSPDLQVLLERTGYRVLFHPHPNIRPYLHLFDLPPHIGLAPAGQGLQTLFLSARAMVTDYSSVAFEMALLKKPVLYFQFDAEHVFGGGHLTGRGYFDFASDGFGPVRADLPGTLAALADLLDTDCAMPPEYAQRAEAFFTHRDGRNCERVVAAIEAIDTPARLRQPDLPNLHAQARAATAGGHRELARARWAALAGQVEEAHLELARACRELGDMAAARQALQAAPDKASVAWRAEHAECLGACGQWQEAAAAWSALADAGSPTDRLRASLGHIECLLRLDDVQGAAREAARLPAWAMEDTGCVVAHAGIAVARGEWPRAAQLWARLSAAEIDALPATQRLRLARTCHRTHQFAHALAHASAVVERDPANAEARYLAGLAAFGGGEGQRLLEHWTVPDAPDIPDTPAAVRPELAGLLTGADHVLLARALRLLGRHDDALGLLAKGRAEGRLVRYAPALVEEADCLAAAGRWGDLAAFCRARAGAFVEPRARARLLKHEGDAHAGWDDTARAELAYRTAAELDPHWAAPLAAQAALAWRRGDAHAASTSGLEAWRRLRQSPPAPPAPPSSSSTEPEPMPTTLMPTLLAALPACGRAAEASALLYREAAHRAVRDASAGQAAAAAHWLAQASHIDPDLPPARAAAPAPTQQAH